MKHKAKYFHAGEWFLMKYQFNEANNWKILKKCFVNIILNI